MLKDYIHSFNYDPRTINKVNKHTILQYFLVILKRILKKCFIHATHYFIDICLSFFLQKMVADIYFRQNWVDTRLANLTGIPPDYTDRAMLPYSATSKMWIPDTFFR